jgi:hypothetical protein
MPKYAAIYTDADGHKSYVRIWYDLDGRADGVELSDVSDSNLSGDDPDTVEANLEAAYESAWSGTEARRILEATCVERVQP